MTVRERGFLLLTSHLGDPQRKVLTEAQLRTLASRLAAQSMPEEDRALVPEDLLALGLSRELAERIVGLLDQEAVLDWYLRKGAQMGCVPLTRVTEGYPMQVRRRLGLSSPGCLWASGNMALLHTPMAALVGSRELRGENRAFAAVAGRQAALQGFTLVSGNARGADTAAQEAALAEGGDVISVVADALEAHTGDAHMLYLSEDGFDLPFSPQRALSRNRIIHSLGTRTLVAQCTYGSGGTWDGTVKNLRFGWSPVFCFDDGSHAMAALVQMGAAAVRLEQLASLDDLTDDTISLFDQ